MTSDREQLRRAASVHEGRKPRDEEQDLPDCPECGATMRGKGDKWRWNFDCPKCGCNLSGDNL